jgi:hypothetical protein
MPAALGCPDDPPTECQPHEISRRLNLTLLAAMQCTAATAQQVSNNPLNPAVTLNFDNYYYPPTG